jgi:hypothetical protein
LNTGRMDKNMKRIDQLLDRVTDRILANGTWGANPDDPKNIFVDSNGYVYFRDSELSSGFGKITFKYRKSSKVTRTHVYNGEVIKHYEYWVKANPTLRKLLRAEIKRRIDNKGYWLDWNSCGERELVFHDPSCVRHAVKNELAQMSSNGM